MDWQTWLGEVCMQHLLAQYQARLESRRKSAEEIVQEYVRDGALDPLFFKDLNINDIKDRRLFQSWFLKECGTGTWKEFNGNAGTKKLTAWLGGVDWSVGALRTYRDALQKSFDSPAKVMEAYSMVVPDGGGAQHFDTGRFCKDFDVKDEHRPLFEAWFTDAQMCAPPPMPGSRAAQQPQSPSPAGKGDDVSVLCSGLTVKKAVRIMNELESPQKAPAAKPGAENGGGGRNDGLEGWTEEVNWSIGLFRQQYGAALRENFDQPSQIAELYVRETAGGTEFDYDQFFEDVGVTDEKHKVLFRAGLLGHLGFAS